MTIDRVSLFILIPMSEQRMKWVIEEKAYRFDFLFKFLPVEYEEEIIWKSLSEGTPAIKLTP